MYLKKNKLENQIPYSKVVINNPIRQAENFRANESSKKSQHFNKNDKNQVYR